MNKKAAAAKEALSTALYGFYACFHPFEGFWNIKHVRKRNFLASLMLLALVCAVMILKLQCTGFLFRIGDPRDNNVFLELLAVVVPVLIWVIVNWSITTLFEGKANMKNIFIATVNALLPLVIIYIPQLFLSYYFTLQESVFMAIMDTAAVIWVCWLLLAGLSSVQDYTIFKTVITSIFTLFAIVALIFLLAVFYSSIQQLFTFFSTFFSELFYWIK